MTAFLGGGHAFSMRMLAETGDWPADFFFTHEETDLAWRALDMRLEGRLRAVAPAPAPQDLARPARRLPPHDGPQPRLAGPPPASRSP